MEQHDAVTQRMEDVTRAYYDSVCKSDCKANTEAVEPK